MSIWALYNVGFPVYQKNTLILYVTQESVAKYDTKKTPKTGPTIWPKNGVTVLKQYIFSHAVFGSGSSFGGCFLQSFLGAAHWATSGTIVYYYHRPTSITSINIIPSISINIIVLLLVLVFFVVFVLLLALVLLLVFFLICQRLLLVRVLLLVSSTSFRPQTQLSKSISI